MNCLYIAAMRVESIESSFGKNTPETNATNWLL